jgi:glycerophosphoryl diester phosphodiesterase
MVNRWLMPGRPLVIAHRGHSVGAPEQTLAAYTTAADLGAEMIEADVQCSRDGRLVMMHDTTLDRTTNGHGPVAALTFAQLRALDAGGWFSTDFAGAPVPSLDEVFELAGDRGLALCLEAKGRTSEVMAHTAMLVAGEIAARGRLDRDVLASFDHQALVLAANAVPGLALAPDRLPERGPSSAEALIAQARSVGAEIIQHHYADLSVDVVDAVHEAGVALWAWPPTSVEETERACALGVDGVMGDDVAVIAAALGRGQGDTGDDASTARPAAAER